MMFLLLIFLIASQFHCVFPATKQVENVNLFNEFMENLLNKNGGGTKQEAKKATLSIADAAKILQLVEKNVAKEIHSSPNKASIRVDKIFTKILGELKEFNHNGKIEKIHQKLTSNDDKVQFFMLLLTFANRLALAIGSIVLEKQRKLLGYESKFSFDSFALAYKVLDEAFPAPVDIRKMDYYYRYYNGAQLQLNADSTAISFNFKESDYKFQYFYSFGTNLVKKQNMAKYDEQIKHTFKTTLNYAVRRQVRVAVLVKELNKIALSSVQNAYIVRDELFEAGYKLSYDLLKLWRWMLHGNEIASDRPNDFLMRTPIKDPTILFALKHFAANLIKLMLHKKETTAEVKKYFEKYGQVEKELNRILKSINSDLDTNRGKYIFDKMSMEALQNNEMLVHFEDVAQIDWKTPEDFVAMSENVNKLITQWKAKFENCKFENGKFINCEIDIAKIKREFKENETVIAESFEHQFFVDMEKFNDFLKQLQLLQTEMTSIKANKEKVKAEMKSFPQNIKYFLTKRGKFNKELEAKQKEFTRFFTDWIGRKRAIEREIASLPGSIQRFLAGVQAEYKRL